MSISTQLKYRVLRASLLPGHSITHACAALSAASASTITSKQLLGELSDACLSVPEVAAPRTIEARRAILARAQMLSATFHRNGAPELESFVEGAEAAYSEVVAEKKDIGAINIK